VKEQEESDLGISAVRRLSFYKPETRQIQVHPILLKRTFQILQADN